MNKRVSNMPTRFAALFTFLLAMPVFAMPGVNRERDEKDTISGIHIRREGDSPFFKEQAKLSVKTLEGACKSMKRACSIIGTDPAASAKAKSRCASVTGVFVLKGGAIGDVGRQVTDEYFVPTRSWSARITRQTLLRQTGYCEAEVADQNKHEIRRYTLGGYTQYERHDSANKGRHWTRNDHRVDPKLTPVLAAAFLAPGEISVSPPMGHETYFHTLKCEVRQVKSAAVVFTNCLYRTGMPFPAELLMSSKTVSDGKVLQEEKAVSYANNAVLPVSLFMPPPSERVESAQTLSGSPDNATQKWCAKQKAKTGINPCEDAPEDDEN